jgi:hypothetical protein
MLHHVLHAVSTPRNKTRRVKLIAIMFDFYELNDINPNIFK